MSVSSSSSSSSSSPFFLLKIRTCTNICEDQARLDKQLILCIALVRLICSLFVFFFSLAFHYLSSSCTCSSLQKRKTGKKKLFVSPYLWAVANISHQTRNIARCMEYKPMDEKTKDGAFRLGRSNPDAAHCVGVGNSNALNALRLLFSPENLAELCKILITKYFPMSDEVCSCGKLCTNIYLANTHAHTHTHTHKCIHT